MARTIATKIIRFRTSMRLGIFLGGDLDEEESGDAYWRRREIAMPDNEGGARLDIPDDPVDGEAICQRLIIANAAARQRD